MRRGFDATRRNRNIGTAKRGHGSDNRLVIPSSRGDREFYCRLSEPLSVVRFVHDRPFRFIVERTDVRFVYPVTIDDCVRLLESLPPSDLEGIEMVVLRQSKRKERILTSNWGRLAYRADIGTQAGRWIASAPAIFLEAISPRVEVRWSRSLVPEDAQELERLRSDGHAIRETERCFFLGASLEAARNTQLYRTVLHEIGHWVHWLQQVVRPAQGDLDRQEALEQAHLAKPTRDREAFAHRYADRLRSDLLRRGVIPFARMLDFASVGREGLRIEDFWLES